MGKVQGRNEGYEYGPAAVVQGIPTKDRRVTNHFFQVQIIPLFTQAFSHITFKLPRRLR